MTITKLKAGNFTRRIPISPDRNPEKGESHVLVWRVHSLRDDRHKTALLCAVIILGGACGYAIFHQALTGFAAALILLFAGKEFLLPQEYRIDEMGISIHSLISHKHASWAEIIRWRACQSGAAIEIKKTQSRSEILMISADYRSQQSILAEIFHMLRKYSPQSESISERGNSHADF